MDSCSLLKPSLNLPTDQRDEAGRSAKVCLNVFCLFVFVFQQGDLFRAKTWGWLLTFEVISNTLKSIAMTAAHSTVVVMGFA